MCELCQRKIADDVELNCETCEINGPGKCDPKDCPVPEVVHYNSSTQMCEEILPKQCNIYKYNKQYLFEADQNMAFHGRGILFMMVGFY